MEYILVENMHHSMSEENEFRGEPDGNLLNVRLHRENILGP